ncbi:galactokinase [Aquimarina sp. D1M17]|uniref:galactokinase n=1 Tax=Aquimarina acroporae TaxID=2937283 RepID=UPI0020C02A29|nr:galactokinase [Aquimarina acroporae]MCK8520724.1 galactokinase [Aquimarina acroporae]
MNKERNFTPDIIVASPGRINFIGGHTDYNNGFVLPAAIDKKIKFEFCKNNTDHICNIYSKNYGKSLVVNLKQVKPSKENWENYILGVLHQLLKRSDRIKGFDCIITSELAIGSGLSSSAALECGFAFGINELFQLNISKLEIAKLSRDAEHEYVGTKCGIMDQYASVFGEKDKVLFLDCKSLEYELIPMNLNDYKILILNTNVEHNLSTSNYNQRREQCEQGVKIIKQKYPKVNSLRDVDLKTLKNVKNDLPELIYQRCLYIIQENERVQNAAQFLAKDDLNNFGKLLYECHEGLRYQYEISCAELDYLVDFSKDKEYVLGSRMMGGGFGGCTVNIVQSDHVDQYIKDISKAYHTKFNITLDAFLVTPSQGTHQEIVHAKKE